LVISASLWLLSVTIFPRKSPSTNGTFGSVKKIMQLSITFVYKYHKDNNKMLDLSAPEKQIPLTTTKKLGNVEFSGYLKSHP